MENNIKYMEETIEILSDALQKLEKLRQETIESIPEEEQIDNIIKETAENVRQIKKAMIG